MKIYFLLMVVYALGVSKLTHAQGLSGVSAGAGFTATPTRCPVTESMMSPCEGGRETPTYTATPSNTPTNTFSPTATGTFTHTPTATVTPVPGSTNSPTPLPTGTPETIVPDYTSLIAVCNDGSRHCLESVDEASDSGLCAGALGGLAQITSGSSESCVDFSPSGSGVSTGGSDNPPTNVRLQARCLCGTTTLYVDIASYSLGASTCAAQSAGSSNCIFNGYKESATPTP
jgi:hypothetical protein